jgi:hypothetical protein
MKAIGEITEYEIIQLREHIELALDAQRQQDTNLDVAVLLSAHLRNALRIIDQVSIRNERNDR